MMRAGDFNSIFGNPDATTTVLPQLVADLSLALSLSLVFSSPVSDLPFSVEDSDFRVSVEAVVLLLSCRRSSRSSARFLPSSSSTWSNLMVSCLCLEVARSRSRSARSTRCVNLSRILRTASLAWTGAPSSASLIVEISSANVGNLSPSTTKGNYHHKIHRYTDTSSRNSTASYRLKLYLEIWMKLKSGLESMKYALCTGHGTARICSIPPAQDGSHLFSFHKRCIGLKI